LARRDSLTGHEQERGEWREEMLDLDRSLVAVVLSAVLDSVIVGHDISSLVCGALLWRPLSVVREELVVRERWLSARAS
jgi:hypothetical protein